MMRLARRFRGLALPIVLWAIAFVAGLVVLVGGSVGDWVTEEARAGRTFRARQMALTGLAFGMNPAVEVGEPLLKSGSPESEGYEVKITNEAGKINPNYWIGVNDRTIFQRLFENWQVDPRLSDTALDSLTDWIDADDFRSLAGAEAAEYSAAGRPGFPANRPLVHIRELEAVIGFDQILAGRGDWRELFTTWHNGKVNIQYASAPVLSALASLTPQQIQALFELRAGPDGVEGNEDDVPFESVDTVASLIGADALQQRVLDAYFDTEGNVRRIESTGFCYGTSHKITVFVGDGQGSQILSWEEQ